MTDERRTWTSEPNDASDGQNLTPLYTLCAHTLVFAERQTQVESAADKHKQQTASRHAGMARLLLLHGTFFSGINVVSDVLQGEKKKICNSGRGNVCKTFWPKPFQVSQLGLSQSDTDIGPISAEKMNIRYWTSFKISDIFHSATGLLLHRINDCGSYSSKAGGNTTLHTKKISNDSMYHP